MIRSLIIGGSDAGISAALRAKECDPAAEVSLVLADAFPNYSICGIPFYLSGEVHDWHQLAHRTTQSHFIKSDYLTPLGSPTLNVLLASFNSADPGF